MLSQSIDTNLPSILPASATDTLGDADYEFLRRLIYEHSRINLGPDKRALVSGRVAKRLRTLKIGSYREYCQWLKTAAGAEELGNLVDVISTNHTYFFREEKHFDWLRSVLLPHWRLCNDGRETFRVWSAASSSGEEPYTLAIVLAEFFGLAGKWTIDATDISTRILDRAGQAIYDAEKLAPVRPGMAPPLFPTGRRPVCRAISREGAAAPARPVPALESARSRIIPLPSGST